MGILLLDAPAPYFWEKHFAKIDELENRFAPVAAFFSGLSAIATAYLISLQMSQNDRQAKDALRSLAENQIFQMFSLRADIVKSLEYNNMGEKYKGNELFEFFYSTMHFLYNSYINQNNVILKYQEKFSISSEIRDAVDGEFGMLVDEHGEKQYPESYELISIILQTLENDNKHLLSPYFHNVYATLKIISLNKNFQNDEKDNYLRIFRAQFSQYEFALVYYHALVHKDKDNDAKKFKELVESTCFFHSIADKFLFAEINAPAYPYGYKETAFRHPS